jgi:hypothetical protein
MVSCCLPDPRDDDSSYFYNSNNKIELSAQYHVHCSTLGSDAEHYYKKVPIFQRLEVYLEDEGSMLIQNI